MKPLSKLKSIPEKDETKDLEKAYTILVVDDEDANLRMLSRIFKEEYNVLTASNGRDALDLLANDPNPKRINLIISDQKMPVMSGVEFLEKSQEIVPKAIRMILTGYSDVDVIINSINKGHVYKYIQKPFEINDIRITVQRALEIFDLEKQKAKLIKDLQKEVEVRKTAEEKLQKLNEELKSAMDQLHQSLSRQAEAEKMAALGGLVAGITHEINTPMGISLTSASYLKDETLELIEKVERGELKKSDLTSFKGKADEAIDIVVANLKRAKELIKSFKQVAVDQTSNENRKFCLKEYIDEILLSLKPKLKQTHHLIKVDCPDGLCVQSNPGAISQILTNFIMNSVIHGFKEIEEGEITISFGVEDNILKMRYTDNGVGMPEEHVEKIFNPFFTTNRENGGSGMGTNIVYNLVTQNLNGKITCESEIGHGIRFDIQIPLLLENDSTVRIPTL